MILDGRHVQSGTQLTTDVCIIGAGPAGIALASELDGSGLDVCLLESGGLDFDRQTDSLNELGAAEGDFSPPNGTRRRQFGGTSNMWTVRLRRLSNGARYLPLSELDFERRDWLPHSGWPFERSELDSFYRRAHAMCGLGPFEYDPAIWADRHAAPLPLDESQVITAVEHFGPGDVFSRQLRGTLRRSPNVRVVLNSNVTELTQLEAEPAVRDVRVACFGGNGFTVRANVYVVAAGTIESARLLLASNQTTRAGIGNEHDLVGRFYMDHLWISCGRLVPRQPSSVQPNGAVRLACSEGLDDPGEAHTVRRGQAAS